MTNRAWCWVVLGTQALLLAEGTKSEFPECRTKLLYFSPLGPLKTNSNNSHQFPEVFNMMGSFLSVNSWDKIRNTKDRLRRNSQTPEWCCCWWLRIPEVGIELIFMYHKHKPECRIQSVSHTGYAMEYDRNTHLCNGKLKWYSHCGGRAALTIQPNRYAVW